MKYLILVILSLAILTLNSCTSEGTADSNKRIDYNYLGNAFCKCAQPTIQLNQELMMLQNTDKQAFLSRLKEAGDKGKESINCCKQSLKNHTTVAPNPKDLRKALKKECEGIPDKMLDEIVDLIRKS